MVMRGKTMYTVLVEWYWEGKQRIEYWWNGPERGKQSIVYSWNGNERGKRV